MATNEVRAAEVRVRVGACSMSDRQDRIPKVDSVEGSEGRARIIEH